jgi:hypothetical protein
VRHDPAQAIEGILRLLPETTNIFVVIGNSELERFWRKVLETDLEPFRNRVTFEWGTGLTFAEMLKRAAALPERSAIFHALMSVDAAGIAQTEEAALAELHSVANAPLFGVNGSQLGHGIVGGQLMSMDELARNTAEVALRILNGESPGNINRQCSSRVYPRSTGASYAVGESTKAVCRPTASCVFASRRSGSVTNGMWSRS